MSKIRHGWRYESINMSLVGVQYLQRIWSKILWCTSGWTNCMSACQQIAQQCQLCAHAWWWCGRERRMSRRYVQRFRCRYKIREKVPGGPSFEYLRKVIISCTSKSCLWHQEHVVIASRQALGAQGPLWSATKNNLWEGCQAHLLKPSFMTTPLSCMHTKFTLLCILRMQVARSAGSDIGGEF